MAALRVTRLPRIVFTVLLLMTVAAIWACGGPAEPAQQAAAPAAPAATDAPAAAATAAPEPTAMPAMAEEDTYLHLAVTPLPQDTYLPWLATSSGHLPFRPMWENLTTISPDTGVSTILPQLAREWDVSPDASEYTFYLQEGVQMHHGYGEFTVKDVILTIDQQMSDPLAGCKAPLKRFMGSDSASEMVANGNMEIIDDYTFKMNLAQPQVDVADWWFNILVVPCVAVRSAAQFEAEGEAMFDPNEGTGPAGTGAYQLARRELKEFTEYEAVPYDHWRVNPEFKRLRITTAPEDLTRLAMLLTGEANMVDVPKVLHQQAIDEGMEIFESPLPSVGLTILPLGQYYVSEVNWNPDTEPWNAPGETGVLVREALNRAINREQIINELFKGRGEPMYNTIFHDSLEGWNPRWADEFEENYGYDPERAKQLLDEAGFPGDNGENRFFMEVWQSSLPGLPETIEVAQTVAQSFQDIGIEVRLEEREFARALDAFRDRHDAHFILPVRQTIRQINANMRIYYYTGDTNPDTGLPNGGVIYMEGQLYDDTYEQLLIETDQAERDRIIRAMGDDIYDTYRTIPIVNIRSTLVVNPEEVAEYKFGSLTGVFGHLEYAKAAR
ncbi:MAG: ABC transporter substrate-binding protein [Chloroflexi bacterium]|nr:ABC transporter substrate-binding protein [Chloroflexota bacterium]